MRVVSLFAGAGGLDLGLRSAGFELVWAVDNYRDAVLTYRDNLGSHVVEADVAIVPSEDIPRADIVVGGFPCQGFSVANAKRSEHDGRNRLYLELVRVLAETQPRCFVAENVKGILSLAGGAVFDTIVQDFRRVGYEVAYAVLNAADYGVPQLRERVFIVGRREDVPFDWSHFPPRPTHAEPVVAAELGLKPWVGVGEALRGLPDPESGHKVPNHDSYSRYKLRFNNYLGHRRIDPAAPAPTVTARGDMRGGVVVLHHPSNKRRISPREMATIQGFPENFRFHGSRTSVYRQVANAVPPPLARAVGRALLSCGRSNDCGVLILQSGTRLFARATLQPSLFT